MKIIKTTIMQNRVSLFAFQQIGDMAKSVTVYIESHRYRVYACEYNILTEHAGKNMRVKEYTIVGYIDITDATIDELFADTIRNGDVSLVGNIK